jgi:hydroxymethylpyrimidine pyrophosphatase-like HAD family hydrolase
MAGFVQAVALDLDGTLTTAGVIGVNVLAAIDECRDRGVVIVLVTGRIWSELEHDFPGLVKHLDAVVCENGAVLRLNGEVHPLAPAVDRALVDALRSRDIGFRTGEVILAGSGGDSVEVIQEIGRLGLDHQVVANRNELMVLPAGVSKGTGLRAALDELQISSHNVIAIGDAENDLSMLETAEIGVAVGNAIDSVRQHADLVLDAEGGEAVAAFLRGPLIDGASVVHPGRRALRIGVTPDGTVVSVPGAQATVLILGGSGSGKSHLAGLLLERWIGAGYTVLAIDPEGDYSSLGRLHRTVVVDAAAPSSLQRVFDVLRGRHWSVVLDLSTLAAERAGSYLEQVAAGVESIRAQHGLPHWILIDEAQVPLGESGPVTELFRPSAGGYCYVTYRPEALCSAVSVTIDLTLTALGADRSRPGEHSVALGQATGQAQVSFQVDPRVTEHVRHRHKYLTIPLLAHHQFVFRDEAGRPIDTAATVEQFADQLSSAPDRSIQHHVERGDFSRWAVSALQDRELSALVSGAENEFNARLEVDLARLRAQLLSHLRQRYLNSP